jgi:signal transduction histidine kinase
MRAEIMSQFDITVIFVSSCFALLSGWLFHSLQQKKHIVSLCEQIGQDQFYISLLNAIVHDILNPIVAAKYSLENLQRKASEDLLPYVNSSLNAIEQLILLVQRIRDMRAFDTGKKSLQFMRIGVNRVMSGVETTFKDRTRAKGIKLLVRKDRQKSQVEIDPIIFPSYVLNNLVDNAIKFSKAGTTIEIAGYAVGADIEFLVKDQGAGMNEETVSKLLEGKFDDICPSPPGLRGLGIGMRQVAKYLELAGGTAHVESRTEEQSPNDHGTVYKIKIPRVQPSKSTQ